MQGEERPFQFNFGTAMPQGPSQLGSCGQQNDEQGMSAEEISPGKEALFAPGDTDAVQLYGGVQLLKGRVPGNAASSLLRDDGLADSDLIPGRYEGGFKLWECAVDLANFLCQHFHIQSSPDASSSHSSTPPLVGTSVLELGCGQGLPGIVLGLCGAIVHFQDYNKEVLTALTIPNVVVNREACTVGPESSSAATETRFFSGSWAALPQLLDREVLCGTYDIVLSAETIYSLDSQRQLLACIKQCLKPRTGRAWIAAKAYYFGVGGGTASFCKLVAEDGTFQASLVAVHDDGASNKREILLLSFRGDG